MRHALLGLLAIGVFAGAMGGCHLITGATDYSSSDDEGNGGSTAGGNPMGGNPSTGGGGSNPGGGGSGGNPPMSCVGANHWECALDQVCIANTCVTAWGRTYRFEIRSIAIANSNPVTAMDWDATETGVETDPDPIVRATDNGSQVHQTTLEINTFTHTWTGETVDLVLNANGGDIEFTAVDDDQNLTPPDNVDDIIIGVVGAPPAWITILRDQVTPGVSTTTGQGSTIVIAVSTL